MSLSDPEIQFVEMISRSRYLTATIMLAALWFAESLAPMRAFRHRGAHGAANLGLALINGAVVFLGAFAILGTTQLSRTEGFGLLHRFESPVWLNWLLAVVLLDCWQYWWHRINHEVGFLWRFHAVHHSDAEMDVTSGVRFHTFEIAFSVLARLLVLPLIGITVPQLALYELLSLPVILFHHSNIRLPYAADSALRWLIVTPWMHQVHHSRLKPETNSNYSSFLSAWDRLFGSFRLRRNPGEISLGLDGWDERQWRGLPGMLAAPFQSRLFPVAPGGIRED